MVRNVVGVSILAVVAVFLLRFLFGLVGLAVHLIKGGLILAAVVFVVYLVVRLVRPSAARRAREKVEGDEDERAEPA